MSFQPKEYPLQQVLELACAAQRVNKDYVKYQEAIYSEDTKVLAYKQANKTLMLATLGEDKATYSDPKMCPQLLCTNLEDQEFANEIQKYYRRLAFAAIEGDNEFLTKVNSILNSENVALNEFGWVACLPSVYKRDYARHQIEKRVRDVDQSYLDEIGKVVLDKDCEVLQSKRSKNFDAWNIDAIIDNKMVSWMSQQDLKLGPAVIVKAKVKDHSFHWKYKDTFITRLNYVKAAQ